MLPGNTVLGVLTFPSGIPSLLDRHTVALLYRLSLTSESLGRCHGAL